MLFQQLRVIAHADWSKNPAKCWLAIATLLPGGSYCIHSLDRVENVGDLLVRLGSLAAASGSSLVGFDFPIGLPRAYARLAGIDSFLDALPGFGEGQWANFYKVASRLDEVSLHRPFYPDKPAGAKRETLTTALKLEWSELYRQCERTHPNRRAACPLFWTLGGQQVGKAAIHGWSEVLVPSLKNSQARLAIWPFSGKLDTLLKPGRVVVLETYPAEFYHLLGIRFSPRRPGLKSGKRHQGDRKQNVSRILGWCERYSIAMDSSIKIRLEDGFGSHSWGEDAFDAMIGLVGMINTLEQWQLENEPLDRSLRRIEGWIFGQSITLPQEKMSST
jgi:hypothetical protein